MIVTLTLSGCSSAATHSSAPQATAPASAAATATSTATGAADASACSGGLNGSESGVVSIDCGGTAEIKFQAGSANLDMHGGTCRSGGGVWSASVGVLLDDTGLHGTYSGPKVNSIVVSDTDTKGKATIQADIGGTHYYDLGNATLTRSADGKTAHVAGVGDTLSDAPNVPIVVDVTC